MTKLRRFWRPTHRQRWTRNRKRFVLTILDHPDPTSFSAALAEAFIAGAQSAGHTTEIADLHEEGFDLRWSKADAEGDRESATPSDILKRFAFDVNRMGIHKMAVVCFTSFGRWIMGKPYSLNLRQRICAFVATSWIRKNAETLSRLPDMPQIKCKTL